MQVFGERWQIVESLGEGGQAHTFQVIDLKGNGETKYALKRLKNIKRHNRFRKEVEALRNVSHPNVIKLIDFDLDIDKPYIVMELCYERDLSHKKYDWETQRDQIFDLFIQICKGVGVAHQAGIVHRDIKPANVLLRNQDGPAVIADFGLCFIDNGQRFTLTGEAVGPVNFMAPEMEDGLYDEIQPSCDVYSLGKLLYWMISGGKIFSREKYLDDNFNLVNLFNDLSLEHLNRFFGKTIVNIPQERLNNAYEVAQEAQTIKRLIDRGHNVVSPHISQNCMYCGLGVYKLHSNPGKGRTNGFNFTNLSGTSWRILICDQCGHTQIFRPDLAAKRIEWWDAQTL